MRAYQMPPTERQLPKAISMWTAVQMGVGVVAKMPPQGAVVPQVKAHELEGTRSPGTRITIAGTQ
jgi:hypothetical protein